MDKSANSKYFDLEERTFLFAKEMRKYVKMLPKTIANIEDVKQVVRSSGSLGANYIEANESLSRKDAFMRIKISKKESKETIYWLRLLDTGGKYELEQHKNELINECTELMKIFGAMVSKS